MPYAITREDGGVSIMRLKPGATLEDEIARAELPSPAVSWRFVEQAEVPARDEYRNAWADTGKAIAHDMTKARELHRDKLRRERAPLLASLDIEYQRADEADDRAAKRSIAEAKQALRDAPSDPRIEAAQTIDDLRAVALPEATARR